PGQPARQAITEASRNAVKRARDQPLSLARSAPSRASWHMPAGMPWHATAALASLPRRAPVRRTDLRDSQRRYGQASGLAAPAGTRSENRPVFFASGCAGAATFLTTTLLAI